MPLFKTCSQTPCLALVNISGSVDPCTTWVKNLQVHLYVDIFFPVELCTVFDLKLGVCGCGEPTLRTVLHYFLQGTSASTDFGICEGSWNSPLCGH